MNRRLTLEERVDMAKLYRSGKFMNELAYQFGIHRVTVSRTLRREGVELRKQGLDPDQVDKAVKLYALGSSLARIGEQFGVDHGRSGVNYASEESRCAIRTGGHGEDWPRKC
jgi:hypothetical protein